MKVRVQMDGFSPVQVFECAQSVVIYDDHGQPIIAVQRTQENQVLSVKAGDPHFNKTIEAMGIGLNARVICGYISKGVSSAQS